jgi:hypothetical protein
MQCEVQVEQSSKWPVAGCGRVELTCPGEGLVLESGIYEGKTIN